MSNAVIHKNTNRKHRYIDPDYDMDCNYDIHCIPDGD